MARKRVPGYITKTHTKDFGLNVTVQRRATEGGTINPGFEPSGDPVPEGKQGMSSEVPASFNYRKVIPAGEIGSEETTDLERLTLPMYVDTVAHYQGEQSDPKLHGPMAALRAAGKQEIPFNEYASFQPRCAPMPRTAGDEGFLEAPQYLSADPLMTDENSTQIFWKRDARKKDLYGANRDGFLHNDNDPYLYHPAVSEGDNAQLSIRRGQAAARMPAGQAKKDFIAKQGEAQKGGTNKASYNQLSRQTAEEGY